MGQYTGVHMSHGFQVSVVIPVYNAVRYVRRAVESAVHLNEVGEIILIDDGYKDGALEVCRLLASEYKKVSVFQHPDGANKGAGASRNLGIQKSTCEFISFLDADDWYLDNRFNETSRMFLADPTIDGVYVPVGTVLEEGAAPVFRTYRTKADIENHLSFTKRQISAENLFSSLLRGKDGSFHTNGITLKRSLLAVVGSFNEKLRLHQDYEYWLRCAYFGRLIGVTSRAPCAVRAVHNENRIHTADIRSRALYYVEVYRFFMPRKLSIKDRIFLFQEYIIYHQNRRHHSDGAILKYKELLLLALKELVRAIGSN